MRLAVVCRGSRHFLDPIMDRWKEKYELVTDAKLAEVIYVEWANEQFPLVTQNVSKQNVVCRVLGQEYYQNFWRHVDRDKVAMIITENPAYEFDGMPSVFIPEPIDTEYWHPNPDVEPEPDTLLMVGSYDYYKGQIDLLRMLLEKSDFSRRVTFVGDFSPEDTHRRINAGKLRVQMEWMAREWGINLEMLDYQPRDKIRELYWSHEYAVSNSLHEGCQTFPQEAMACGCLTMVAGWMGAEGIYPGSMLFSGSGAFWRRKETLDQHKDEFRAQAREWATQVWSYDVVYPQLDAVLEAVA